MPTQWQVDSLFSRIACLNNEINRVASKEHPYPEPAIIFNALKSVLIERESTFHQIHELYGTSKDVWDRRAFLTQFEHLAKDLDRITALFSHVDRVDSARIPFEILRPLSWISESLFHEECRALVRLDGFFTYSVTSCFRKFEEQGWSEHWESALKKSGKRVNVLLLGFPSAEANSILLHALAAHEFGHELMQRQAEAIERIRNKSVEDIKASLTEDFRDYIESIAREWAWIDKGDSYQLASNHVDVRMSGIAEDWISELAADLAATRMVGPAFIAALDKIIPALGNEAESHPPGYLRRRWARKYLEHRFPKVCHDPVWSEVLGANVEEEFRAHYIGLPTNETERKRRLPYALVRFGEKICDQSFDEICSIVDLIPSPLTDEEALAQNVSLMEDFIENLAPPSVPLEIRNDQDASKFWLLMYGAWHFRLNRVRYAKFLKRHGWDSDPEKGEEAIGNLLLHALKSIELRFCWHSYSEVKKARKKEGKEVKNTSLNE